LVEFLKVGHTVTEERVKKAFNIMDALARECLSKCLIDFERDDVVVGALTVYHLSHGDLGAGMGRLEVRKASEQSTVLSWHYPSDVDYAQVYHEVYQDLEVRKPHWKAPRLRGEAAKEAGAIAKLRRKARLDCFNRVRQSFDFWLQQEERFLQPVELEAKPESPTLGASWEVAQSEKSNEISDDAATAKRPSWFPEQPQTLEKWRKSFQVILKTREEYSQRYENMDTEEPNPSIDDLRDALATMPEWGKKPSRSTVQRIKKAGDIGWLD
jgi:hypothetical protein